MILEEKRKAIEEFEYMRNLAELRVLSEYSIDNVPTEAEYLRMMELKKLVFKEGDDDGS